GERVVEIEAQVIAEPLAETQLERVVIRRAECRIGGKCRVLRMEEEIIAEAQSIIPQQLHEGVIGRIPAAHGSFGDSSIRRLGSRQVDISTQYAVNARQTR